MSVYWSRDSAQGVYGFFESGNTISFVPGAGFSVDAVVQHELVHARLVDLSVLGFVQQALRACALHAATRSDLAALEHLKSYAGIIQRSTDQVHETAAWTLTEMMELMNPKLHALGLPVGEVRIPKTPRAYSAGCALATELYLVSAARTQRADGSLDPGAHPLNYAALVQAMAVWALSPAGLIGTLESGFPEAEAFQALLRSAENQPTKRFLSLFPWAQRQPLSRIRDVVRLSRRGDIVKHAPIPVSARPQVGGARWRALVSQLSAELATDLDRVTDGEMRDLIRAIDFYNPDVDDYAQVAVLQPSRPLNAVPAAHASLAARLDGSLICQIHREPGVMDLAGFTGAAVFGPDECDVSMYSVGTRMATGFLTSAHDIRGFLAAGAGPGVKTHTVVSSVGYDFGEADFTGEILAQVPHAVVAVTSFAQLWLKLTVSGGICGLRDIEYLVRPSGFPDEYSFVTFKARDLDRVAVVTALPTKTLDRIPRFASRADPARGIRLSRTTARLVDWAPSTADCVIAAWCLWERWIPFQASENVRTAPG